MGFFDLFGKKNASCARCNATLASGEGQSLNGKQYCAACYRRMQQVAGQQSGARNPGSQNRGNAGTQTGGQSRGNQGGGNSFESKFADKYGKGGGSTGSTGYSGGSSGYSGGSTGKSSGYSGSSGSRTYPAPLQDIKAAFDRTDTKYRESSNGKVWEVVAGFSGKEKNYTIKYMCTSPEDDSLAIRIFGIVSVERSQYGRVYPVLQQLQDKYRFLRFTLDKDGDVNVEYDMTCCSTGAGLAALEMAIRITQILDESYPLLKRAAYL